MNANHRLVTCNTWTPAPLPAIGPLAIASPGARGLRGVVLWLPDVTDPAYQARLADECQRLADLTPDETGMATGFTRLADRTEGWREPLISR
jgi:hypothetical protein